MYKVISFWSLMLLTIFGQAQGYTLQVNQDNKTSYYNVTDSLSAIDLLQDKINVIRSNGYLGATIDSIPLMKDTIAVKIEPGNVYNHIKIQKHNLSSGYLADSQITISRLRFLKLQDLLLTNYEESGYPFAQLYINKPVVINDTLGCELLFDAYSKFVYDTTAYIGDCSLSKKYISKYLGIEQGKQYNETDIKDIDKKLRNLPLVRLNAPTRVAFYQGLARVILNLNDVVTDRIDGIVGLAPNSSNSSANSLLITGEVNVELNNLLKSGKQFELHWRNYLQNSQKLNVALTYPYILNTKLGINGEFGLNKFDSIFVNLKSKISFRYQQKGNNYLQFYYQNISSNLLSVDTNLVRSQKTLPTNNPYKIDNYGLAAFQRDFDYLPNPRKGYSLFADIAIGQKTIRRNTQVNEVKFLNDNDGQLISLYDTLNAKNIRLDFKISSTFFIPIKQQSTFLQKIHFEALFADYIQFNELYNIGGFSSLRGFDENEIFASKLLSYTAEYRYLIGENSNVGLFVNAAVIENKLDSPDLIKDIPYGFGASANIQVGKGILNLAYALGSQQGNPIKLNAAKFHFGVVNYF